MQAKLNYAYINSYQDEKHALFVSDVGKIALLELNAFT